MAIPFLFARPHFFTRRFKYALCKRRIAQCVYYGTDVRFDDNELRPLFTETAAHQIVELILVNLAGAAGMIPFHVVFFTKQKRQRYGVYPGTQQQAFVRFRTDRFFAAAQEIDSTAKILFRPVRKGTGREDIGM